MKEIALVLAIALGVATNLGVLGLFLLARRPVYEIEEIPPDETTKKLWPTPPE